MKFAVQLKGSESTLENVAPFFQDDYARIRKIGDTWFLESSAFNACAAPLDVFPIADGVLRLIHRVTSLYATLYSPFEVGYVQAFDDSGVPASRALRGSEKINVYSLEELKKLQQLRTDESFGSAVVGAAITDKKIQEALALIGDGDEIQWVQLYNILEFLGGVEAIVKRKWATRKQARTFRQTANHHRHLGSPKKYPLPPDPPSLREAATLVLGFLQKWISEKL